MDTQGLSHKKKITYTGWIFTGPWHIRSRYTAHSSWGLFSNLIRSFPFSCGLSVESVSLTGVQYLASVWEDELKSQETWCNIFWGYLGPCKLSKKKQSRLGGGTLWYQVIYNRDSDQGDDEYINYWRNKKKRKGKIQPINTLLFSKRYLERLLLHDLPQAPQKCKKGQICGQIYNPIWKLSVSITCILILVTIVSCPSCD